MSKPALGRGLASLLQEETDRGAVKAPGLASWKGPEQPAAAPTVPASDPVLAGSPATLEPTPGPVVSHDPLSSPPASVSPRATPEIPVAAAPVPAVSADPIPASVSAEAPLSDSRNLVEAVASPSAPSRAQASTPSTPSVPSVPTTGGATATAQATAPQAMPSPASGFQTMPQLPMPQTSSGTPVPGWIVPALVAGDLLVVLSGILWASWGRGWGRWPWIAALFAVGCTQAIAALFLSRSGERPSNGPLTGRPGTPPGQSPGIRVRFVEEKPQSRRGDRR